VPKHKSTIEGIRLLNSDLFADKRGYFYEKYNRNFLSTYKVNFVQENISLSKKGTIRGIHWQSNPKAQDKLVTCVYGEIFDIAVDLRKESKTFGSYCSFLLNSNENKSIWIPKGFAHGFQALTNDCVIAYSVTNDYSFNESRTLHPFCPTIAVEWPISKSIISDSDLGAIKLSECIDLPIFF